MHDLMILVTVVFLFLCLLIFPLKKKVLFAPILFIIISVAYLQFGGWFEWQDHLRAEQKTREAKAMLESMGSVEHVISRLEAVVGQNPKDAKAWYLLGRLYSSDGKVSKAKYAFVMARSLDNENEAYQINALAMLAMDAYQQKNYELAIEHWEALLKRTPSGSEEAAKLRQAIAKAQGNAQRS